MKLLSGKSQFKIHYVFYLLSAVVTLLIIVLSTVYLSSYYDSEKTSLESTILKNLDQKVKEINKSLADTEANLGYVESYAHLSLKYKNVARDAKATAHFLSQIIAPYRDQYNAYIAWNREKSREYCGTDGCIEVVRKTQKSLGKNSDTSSKDIEYVRFAEPLYQNEKSELWYSLPQSSYTHIYTPVYFDTNYMKIYMFSCVKAVRENGHVVGVIGIDMPILNFTESLAEFEDTFGGYVYVVDESGNIIDQFASSKGLAKLKTFHGQMPQKEGLLEELHTPDAKTYLSATKKIQSRNWHLVAYKDKDEAYLPFNRQLTILVILGMLTTFFLAYASLWVGNILTQEVGDLLVNLRENERILDKSSEGDFSYKSYSTFTLEEFSQIGKFWNRFLKKLQDSLQRYQEEKNKAYVAKQTQTIFLANMSHEIRTPMNAILGMAELLSETPLNTEQKKYVQVFENSARGLLQIINQILDMSRVEIGEVQIENTSFSLRQLLEEIHLLFESKARQKNIEFTLSIDPQLAGRLVGDPLRVKQVVVNLVANAFKFTFSGKVAIEANLDNAQTYRISVTDTGIGISDENKEHIFERFTQADASIARRFGGTGLGLSISKSLSHLMGGDITVTSEIDRGSTFTVFLPHVPVGNTIVVPAEKTPLPKPKIHNKFLLVDDVQENQMVVSLYLKSLGIEFELASNGKEACDMALANSYDLIIMDIQMPVMDGVEALKQIRLTEKELGKSPVPIVALSAFAMEHEQKRYLEEGFDGYLTKPVRKTELIKMIESQLG